MKPSGRAPTFTTQARSRLLAALALSVLLHLIAPHLLSGGPRGSAKPQHSPPTLSARIMVEPQLPVADAVPDKPASPRELREPAPLPTHSPESKVVARETPVPSRSEPARASSALPETLDLTYYPAKQLDVYPTLSTAIDLKYRGKAADEGVAGRALLLVMIDEIGAVKEVSVVEAEPANYFEEDAKRAFMAARFTPAQRNGRAVRSRVLIEVNYGVERGSP